MLIEKRAHAGILDGSITVLFRRWRTPQAVPGRVYRTAAGRVAVDAVDKVAPARITKRDARAAGYGSADEARADLRGDPADPVYRVRLRPAAGPDPRAELAAAADLDGGEIAAIAARLDRLDQAGSHGPWTRVTLRLIEARPATRAPDLAASLGRETQPFKVDVRKLKNLGLTLSLEVGYRLSPRGTAFLAGADGP
ncbi:hypothetical protein [Actinokineospora sp.]|uniref:hypothetical protein n=1 Tax=Actinokineospora sp. TaxID=1872133 RepID=UPI004037836F